MFGFIERNAINDSDPSKTIVLNILVAARVRKFLQICKSEECPNISINLIIFLHSLFSDGYCDTRLCSDSFKTAKLLWFTRLKAPAACHVQFVFESKAEPIWVSSSEIWHRDSKEVTPSILEYHLLENKNTEVQISTLMTN